MQRVQVKNKGESWLGTECYINGQKIPNVRAVDFRVAVDEVPTFTFETMGLPDIDMRGDMAFRFAPETVVDAVKVLRHDLLNDPELYGVFLASIESALKEIPAKTGLYKVAEKILERIIGEEIDGEE